MRLRTIQFVLLTILGGTGAWAEPQSLAPLAGAPEAIRRASGSVAMMLDPAAVQHNGQGAYRIETYDLGFCSGHPFRQERGIRGLDCSSFLVAPRIVMTAGHCLDENACPDSYFVFGVTQTPREPINENQVYRCRRVLGGRRFGNRGAAPYHDYAIIELDREVTGRTPLIMRASPREVLPVFALGHPDDLAMKYSSGSVDPRIPSVGDGNIGDYEVIAGMSGGPLLDSNGQVLGVITSGPFPFTTDRQCRDWHRISRAAGVGSLREVRDPENTHNPNASGATRPEVFYPVLVRAMSLVREENRSPVVIDRGGRNRETNRVRH